MGALQDARKGVLFDSFPPVLQLQLKRFEYDFQRDVMVKVGFTIDSRSSSCKGCTYCLTGPAVHYVDKGLLPPSYVLYSM